MASKNSQKKPKKKINIAIRILLATNAIVLLAGAMLGPIYALFVEDIGGDILDIGLAAAAFSVAAGITVIFVGRKTDSVKEPELIIVYGYLVMAVGYALFVFTSSIWWLLLVQLLIGFGEAIYSPAYDALYSIHSDKHQEGAEWGMWESMSYFTAAVGSLLGALLVHFAGFNTLFIAMALLCLVSAVYIYRLPRTTL